MKNLNNKTLKICSLKPLTGFNVMDIVNQY